jgi:hypothetical protein
MNMYWSILQEKKIHIWLIVAASAANFRKG